LLTMLGLISILISTMVKIAMANMIRMSRVITITDSQSGITLSTARHTNEEDRSSLSAMGSNMEPRTVYWLKYLANNPSRASLIAAKVKINRAAENIPFNNEIMKSGTSRILLMVRILGMLMGRFIGFNATKWAFGFRCLVYFETSSIRR
jgi:hypothetical protein